MAAGDVDDVAVRDSDVAFVDVDVVDAVDVAVDDVATVDVDDVDVAAAQHTYRLARLPHIYTVCIIMSLDCPDHYMPLLDAPLTLCVPI